MELLQKLKSILEKLDLSEKEIVFYVAVLKSPHSTVYEIAKKCGFPKDRAYTIFDSLRAKGLLTVEQRKNRRELLPASLKNFSQNIYEKSCKLWKYAETLKKLDPILPFMSENRKARSIEAFAVDQFPEHWEDLSYWDWDEVFAYGNFEMMIQADKDALPSDCAFRDRRTKRGKFANPVLLPGPYTNELIKNDERELRQTQVLHIDKLKNDFIVVFPSIDRVSLWSRGEDGGVSGTFIHDADLTRFHTRMHEYFRQIADKAEPHSEAK